jgi:Nucleoside-diphosphate-sugar epimerases
MRKIAVLGASGFVGAHLCERLIAAGTDEVVPVIHSSGSAWRLARRGVPLRSANLLDKHEIASALNGCTHVVNCSRGGDDVMLRGLRNLLDVCDDLRIAGFVHLSSVMVYGDPPTPESTSESAPLPRLIGYGAIKAQQDSLVMKAASRVPSAILCPPNITGPYSPYLINLIDSVRNGRFAQLEDGSAPCVTVDVDNLAFAIELALQHCSTAPKRLFITDDDPVTWAAVIQHVQALAGGVRVDRIGLKELRDLHRSAMAIPRRSPLRSVKHLVSGEVREALRQDPLLARLDTFLRKGVGVLGVRFEDRMRLAISGPLPIPRMPAGSNLNVLLCAQQLRGVRHSPDAARRTLGYRPLHTFEQSMVAFRRWYEAHTGRDSDFWPLLKRLWA